MIESKKLKQFLLFLFLFLIGHNLYADFFLEPKNQNIKTKITGVYSSLMVNKESGDISGIEIIISKSYPDKYYAIFQASEGQPRKPIVVDVVVTTNNKIKFVVNEEHGYRGAFEGIINDTGLKGKFLGGQLSPLGKKNIILKRQFSFWMSSS